MTPRASSPTSGTSTSPSLSRAATRRTIRRQLSASDKIDRIVTNRWLGLPIFAVVMFLVYYIAMVTVGSAATDWANDGLFGDGWHLFGIGTSEYTEVADNYTAASRGHQTPTMIWIPRPMTSIPTPLWPI